MSPSPSGLAQPAGRGPTVSEFALWNLGFRPFYLLAAAFAAVSVLLWTAQFSGLIRNVFPHGAQWHGHEMLFGFTVAVIAGFLLTAVPNWSGQRTPTGPPLMALAALWVLGRLLVLAPWPLAAMLVNAAFPIAIAAAIGVPLLKGRNARNYFLPGLLVLLGILVTLVHLSSMRDVPWSAQLGLRLGLDVVLFVMVVIAGRVIPMFTNNGVPGAGARRLAWLERVALGSVIALFVADLLHLPNAAIAGVAAVAGLSHAARLALWHPWRTGPAPLVWILHAAYGWIVLHLMLRGMAAAGIVAESYAIHALTVGAIGSLTLGMMVRTARGHTGRPLRADPAETAMFVLMQVAAVSRVFSGIVSPALYMIGLQLSAVLWSLAYGLYVVRYWPILTRPRLDGRPG
jgi:uncharacterized protein involved in response to NO